jgi:hypothetical protein
MLRICLRKKISHDDASVVRRMNACIISSSLCFLRFEVVTTVIYICCTLIACFACSSTLKIQEIDSSETSVASTRPDGINRKNIGHFGLMFCYCIKFLQESCILFRTLITTSHQHFSTCVRVQCQFHMVRAHSYHASVVLAARQNYKSKEAYEC